MLVSRTPSSRFLSIGFPHSCRGAVDRKQLPTLRGYPTCRHQEPLGWPNEIHTFLTHRTMNLSHLSNQSAFLYGYPFPSWLVTPRSSLSSMARSCVGWLQALPCWNALVPGAALSLLGAFRYAAAGLWVDWTGRDQRTHGIEHGF